MRTCILLGDEAIQPPRHMMQGEKQKGIILLDGERRDWTWEGFCSIDGQRYIYFDEIDIEPFDRISDKYRDRALELVRDLAGLLVEAGDDFTSPLVGTFTTWRVCIVQGRGLLVLPPDLGDLMSIYMTDDERYEGHGCYIKGSTEEGFALIRQFGQFLYYALTGTKPYESRQVREAGFHDVPLDVYKKELFSRLDEKTIGFINFTLHAREREQRDVMGNRNATQNLAWFTDKTKGLDWSVDAVAEGETRARADVLASSEEVSSLMEEIARKARRRNFWRVKGTIITTGALVAVLLIILVSSYIANILKPPYTRDMDQEEMIYAFYEAQNNLSVDQMTDPLDGCSAPQESEVISLYVTSTTRSAYEGMVPAIPADDWVAAGCPAIRDTQFVYGVTNLRLTDNGDNSWHIEADYYTPYPYNDEDEAAVYPEGKVLVYKYDMQQDLTFGWNDRGWWNITDVGDITVQFDGTVEIDTYQAPAATAAAMV